ncbi:MAG: hypothetical protein NZ889_01745 [Candidatus Pacearchaeota archaeon]|nr:hypothetical protein [Candidatus Pacearchaeota archaeon]
MGRGLPGYVAIKQSSMLFIPIQKIRLQCLTYIHVEKQIQK